MRAFDVLTSFTNHNNFEAKIITVFNENNSLDSIIKSTRTDAIVNVSQLSIIFIVITNFLNI